MTQILTLNEPEFSPTCLKPAKKRHIFQIPPIRRPSKSEYDSSSVLILSWLANGNMGALARIPQVNTTNCYQAGIQ